MPRPNWEDFPSLSNQRAGKEGLETPVEVLEIPELEALTLESLNLKTELLTQYNRTRQMLHEASYDKSVPLNQKAQVINSATSILGALIRSEAELHSLEEVKKIEAVLIQTLRLFPETQDVFLRLYKEAGEIYSVS